VSPVRYELGFISQKTAFLIVTTVTTSNIVLTGWALWRRRDVSNVRYELGFYKPQEGILHGHRRENLKSNIALTGWDPQRRRNVSPVRYELDSYKPDDGILHSHQRENLKYYILWFGLEIPGFRSFSEKYWIQHIQEQSTLRKHYLPICY
jgi:hypothetical protein